MDFVCHLHLLYRATCVGAFVRIAFVCAFVGTVLVGALLLELFSLAMLLDRWSAEAGNVVMILAPPTLVMLLGLARQ